MKSDEHVGGIFGEGGKKDKCCTTVSTLQSVGGAENIFLVVGCCTRTGSNF